MIDSSMFLRLHDMTIEMNKGNNKISKRKRRRKRREIKLIVDSSIEQIYEYYFHLKPNGIQNIRRNINDELKKFTNNEDIELLESLRNVLRSYDTAFSKDYTDYTESFQKFLENEFKALSFTLANHSNCLYDENAMKLRSLISEKR